MLCNKTVKITFCGHRDVIEYNAVYKELLSTLEQFFIFSEYNGTLLEFYCGGYGTFDSMSSKAISELKEKYPKSNIKKLLITPYITKSHQEKIDSMRKNYDEVVFPPLETVPLRFAIPERNKWMVRECDYVIAYVTHGWGGAAQTLHYAYVKRKKIFRIASNYDVT